MTDRNTKLNSRKRTPEASEDNSRLIKGPRNLAEAKDVVVASILGAVNKFPWPLILELIKAISRADNAKYDYPKLNILLRQKGQAQSSASESHVMTIRLLSPDGESTPGADPQRNSPRHRSMPRDSKYDAPTAHETEAIGRPQTLSRGLQHPSSSDKPPASTELRKEDAKSRRRNPLGLAFRDKHAPKSTPQVLHRKEYFDISVSQCIQDVLVQIQFRTKAEEPNILPTIENAKKLEHTLVHSWIDWLRSR